LLLNPIFSEASRIQEVDKLRNSLKKAIQRLNGRQKNELSNADEEQRNGVRQKEREKIQDEYKKHSSAVQRKTVKATAQILVTAYVVFPVLIG